MKRIFTVFVLTILTGCTTISSRDKITVSRLKSVIVPEVHFQDAAMSDAVEFVANSWHCICHPWVYPTQKIEGNSVIYHFYIDDFDPHDSSSSCALIKGTNKTEIVRLGPTVTFYAEKINLHDLLIQLVRQVDGTLEFNDDGVTIKTKLKQLPVPPKGLQNETAVQPEPF